MYESNFTAYQLTADWKSKFNTQNQEQAAYRRIFIIIVLNNLII